MELILIRHGLPIRVEKKDGSAADPELSMEGMEQAKKMALWLKKEKLDVIYCSPMKRAKMTAEPLAVAKQMDIVFENGVAEIDQDASSYIPLEEIKEKHPEQWQEIVKKDIHSVFNEFQDVNVFSERVVKSLGKIIAENKGKRVAVVCHGGIINIWASHVLENEEKLFFFQPQYTSLNRFMASSSGVNSIVSLNEVGHLRDDLIFK